MAIRAVSFSISGSFVYAPVLRCASGRELLQARVHQAIERVRERPAVVSGSSRASRSIRPRSSATGSIPRVTVR